MMNQKKSCNESFVCWQTLSHWKSELKSTFVKMMLVACFPMKIIKILDENIFNNFKFLNFIEATWTLHRAGDDKCILHYYNAK